MDTTTIVIAILIAIAFYFIYCYNRLIIQKSRCNKAWNLLNNKLNQRGDLIPKLINTVKNDMVFETSLMDLIKKKHSEARAAMTLNARKDIEFKLTDLLEQLLKKADDVHSLASTEEYQAIRSQFAELHETIHRTRFKYNEIVDLYNQLLHTFPSNHFANMLHLEERKFFG